MIRKPSTSVRPGQPVFSHGSPRITGVPEIGTIRTYGTPEEAYSWGVQAEPPKFAIPTFTQYVGPYAQPIPTSIRAKKGSEPDAMLPSNSGTPL